jgi:hypothetical protein
VADVEAHKNNLNDEIDSLFCLPAVAITGRRPSDKLNSPRHRLLAAFMVGNFGRTEGKNLH